MFNPLAVGSSIAVGLQLIFFLKQRNQLRRVLRAQKRLYSAMVRQEERQDCYEQILALGASFSGGARDQKAIAGEIIRLLIRAMRPEVRAAAVISIDRGRSEMIDWGGLDLKRAESAVLDCASEVFHRSGSGKDGSWGFHAAEEHPACDLRMFGIGASLFVPLRSKERIAGVLYLGFSAACGMPGQKRRMVLQGIAEHAAAVFDAAESTHKVLNHNRHERDLLLAASHDVKAPGARALYAVRELLAEERGALNPAQKDSLVLIEEALGEQYAMIGGVLEFAAGQGEDRRQKDGIGVRPDICLGANLSSLFESYRRIAQIRGIEYSAPDLSGCWVRAEPQHVKRICGNLLSNAFKYTDRGKIGIGLLQHADSLELIVSDTGLGIPIEDREQLFNNFFRGTNGKLREGTGLGLAAVRRLTEANGGRVCYRPGEVCGSEFSVLLPRGCNPNGAHRDIGLDHVSVLIVEDDATSARMLERFLQGRVRDADSVGSVSAVIDRLSVSRPSLIVADFAISGGTLLNYLDKIDPGIPLVIVTGNTDISSLAAAKQGRNSIILEKPVDRETLFDAILEVWSAFNRDQGTAGAVSCSGKV